MNLVEGLIQRRRRELKLHLNNRSDIVIRDDHAFA